MTETRELRVMEAELRAEEAGGGLELRGQAVVYGRMSQDLGGFREVFAAGSLTEGLQERDVAALWQHDPALVLGRVGNGTLRLEDSEQALTFAVEPPATTWARDAMVSVARGDVHQMSFGFSVPQGGDEWQMAGDEVVRIVRRAVLHEISPVTFPAYRQTSVELQTRAAELRAAAQPAAESGQPEGGARARLDLERTRFELLGMEVDE
jgi:HK97 family phage prohead protease